MNIKKLTASLLATLLCFSLLGGSVSAIVYQNITATSALSVRSDGVYWKTGFSFTDKAGASFTINSGKTLARLYVGGHAACCLMLGTDVRGGDTYIPNGNFVQIWNDFSVTEHTYIGLAMAFGAPDECNEYYYATKAIIWEISCGFRTCDANFATTKNLLNNMGFDKMSIAFDSAKCAAKYNEIQSIIRAWYVVPNGLAKPQVTTPNYSMNYNPTSGKWEYTLTDSNGVLANYNLSCSNSAFSVSKSGNTITVSAGANASGSCSLTANKIIPAYSSTIEDEGLVVWYREGKQAMITGAYLDPVNAKANFTVQGSGSLTLNKSFFITASDGSTKITSANIGNLADVGTTNLADLYAAVRFTISANIDGTTYYAVKSTGGNGQYGFGGFTTDKTAATYFELNTSNGSFWIGKNGTPGLPKGLTYIVTETTTFGGFKLGDSRTVTLGGDYTAEINNSKTSMPNITSFVLSKDVFGYMGDQFDTTELGAFYDSASFRLFTYASESDRNNDVNRVYLRLSLMSAGRYAGAVSTTASGTTFAPTATTLDRAQATAIKLASATANGVNAGQAWIYNLPTSFANGLYLEESLEGDYAGRYGAASESFSALLSDDSQATYALAEPAVDLLSEYGIANRERYFQAYAFKADTNGDNTSSAFHFNRYNYAAYLDGGEWGLYNSADELLATAICSFTDNTEAQGNIVFPILPYAEDETYYIKEITAPTGYVIDPAEYPLTLRNDGAYMTELSASPVQLADKPAYAQLIIEKTDSTTTTALEGAVFELVALDDIYVSNQLVFSAGEVVTACTYDSDTWRFSFGTEKYSVTTNAEGKALFDFLPFGSYEVIEAAVPSGYVLNVTTETVTLTEDEASQSIGYNVTNLPISNTLQQGILHIYKTDSATAVPLAGAEFTVYAAEDFIVGGVTVHQAGDVICVLVTDAEGNASNLIAATDDADAEQIYTPMYVGAKYYFTETKAPTGYKLNSTQQAFGFEYKGSELEYSELTYNLNNEKTPTTTTTTTTVTVTTPGDSSPDTGYTSPDGLASILLLLCLSAALAVVSAKERGKTDREAN